MKFIFLFIFLLPMASALAVTPTSLDFGELARGETATREILVINTLSQTHEFRMTGVYSEDFSLDAHEKKKISIILYPVDENDGMHTDVLRVEEVYGDNLVNAVSLPVAYRIRGGAYTNETLNFDSVHMKDPERVAFIVLLGIAAVGAGSYALVYFRKKKKILYTSSQKKKKYGTTNRNGILASKDKH